MSVLTRLQRTLMPTPEKPVRCALCGGRFAHEPLNCPACGSTTFVDGP